MPIKNRRIPQIEEKTLKTSCMWWIMINWVLFCYGFFQRSLVKLRHRGTRKTLWPTFILTVAVGRQPVGICIIALELGTVILIIWCKMQRMLNSAFSLDTNNIPIYLGLYISHQRPATLDLVQLVIETHVSFNLLVPGNGIKVMKSSLCTTL